MMQFHKVMEPIFARLGVKLITRNVGMGGLGTVQNGIGSGSIYGDEVDLLIWDSGEFSLCTCVPCSTLLAYYSNQDWC